MTVLVSTGKQQQQQQLAEIRPVKRVTSSAILNGMPESWRAQAT